MGDYSDRRPNHESLNRGITINSLFRELHLRENLEDITIRAGIIVVSLGVAYGAMRLIDYYNALDASLK